MKSSTHPRHSISKSDAAQIRTGRMTLGAALGLDAEEKRALRREARRLTTRGAVDTAADLLRILLACDPLDSASWRAVGALEARCGRRDAATLCSRAERLLAQSPPTLTSQHEANKGGPA